MKLQYFLLLITIAAVTAAAGCVHYSDTPEAEPPIPVPTGTQNPEPAATQTGTAAIASTPKPQMTQMPDHRIDGSGTMQTWEIWLDKGVSTISVGNSGTGTFLVWLCKNGVRQDLLFNELNAYQGSAVFEITESGFYTFDVVASGTWDLIIDGPYDASLTPYVRYRDNGIQFITGANSMTSSRFTLEKGITVFNGYYTGTGSISAVLYADGVNAGVLDTDRKGPARTETAYPAPVSGSYTISTDAGGSWGFEVSQPVPANPQAFTTIRGTGDTVTNYYEMTGDYMLTISGSGPMHIAFYEEGGTVAMDTTVPADASGFQYLFRNPEGYKSVVCLVAVTADGDWVISPVRA